MELPYLPRDRPERLIATGRVVLAASSLLAVWLDPLEPAQQAPVAYGLLVAYLGYSAVVALLVPRLGSGGRAGRFLSHAFDLLFFSLFIYFTAGPSSPFFAYFVFSLVCATLRWHWRGTLWTAVAALTAYLLAGLYFGTIQPHPAFALDEFIIRGVYLGVVAVLLGYLGLHEERTRREVSALAAWPTGPIPDGWEALAELVLERSAYTLAAPRVLVELGSGGPSRLEGPYRLLRGPGGIEERPDLPPDLVTPELAGDAFLCRDVRPAQATAVHRRDGSLLRFRGRPLQPAVAEALGVRSVLGVPLRGELVRGRLFFLDRAAVTVDDLLLAEVVASLAAALFDRHHLLDRLRRAAAVEERVRLSRDLHDGVLQALTGIALRLEALLRGSSVLSAADAGQLREIQELIAAEQRDLRFLIDEMRPTRGGESEPVSLEERLGDLATRIRRVWGLEVELATELPAAATEERSRDLYLLVREALFNAARHGGAARARVTLTGEDDGYRIVIADDGRGFPFQGRRELPELVRRDEGPRSVRERTAGLGGWLVVDSSADGARLEIRVPEGEP